LTGELLRSSSSTGVGTQFAQQLTQALHIVHSEIAAPWSERELAVLALLPTLLSGGEIADELTVARQHREEPRPIHSPEARCLHPA
jgi:LuxR family maltose regulon positive regulatory protein